MRRTIQNLILIHRLSLLIIVLFFSAFANAQDSTDTTYDEKTLIDAGTESLGAGAENVAKVIENLFSKYGEPNAYISGSEAGGGFVVGLRYGGGKLMHKIEGEQPIHWTGPSIGFDAGAGAVKTFALVYNLYDAEEIYRRFPALEGSFYFVGGMGVSIYSSKGIRIALVRLGAGLRAQATVGYMKFSKKKRINPF